MKRWLKLFGILFAMMLIALAYWRWQYNLTENRFMRVQKGMKVDEVRSIMGRVEDNEFINDADTARSWRGGTELYEVRFDRESGLVFGKSIERGPMSGSRKRWSDY